jgi:putative redox protein
MKARINWIKDNELRGETASGNTVIMDSTPEGMPSKGASPKELILQGLAGCTMLDVVLMLKKGKKNLENFRIDIDSEIAEGYPKVFTNINLKYIFTGSRLDEESVVRAIELSREKYCAVYGMLRHSVNITYTFEINNKV